MASIKELVEKHSKVPGDIKIAHEVMPIRFRPFFLSSISGYWFGRADDGGAVQHNGNDTQWKLYTEPKPKVKRAQYLVKYESSSVPFISDCLWESEEEARIVYPAAKLTRLPETEREFDE
jgi:hypothetical protein